MNKNERNNGRPAVYGMVARYGSEEKLLQAVRRTAKAGYRQVETYSPFPVDGVDGILGFRKPRIQWVVFFGGLAGGVGGFLMQYIANVYAYPLNIGGRPFNSWPAFIPITFELTILIASLSGLAALLIGCRLPEVYHPMFNVPSFRHMSTDGFFLCIMSDDKIYDAAQTRAFLEETSPDEVQTVAW